MHVWPGLVYEPAPLDGPSTTPGSVWNLPYDVWCAFAHAVDDWLEAVMTRGVL